MGKLWLEMFIPIWVILCIFIIGHFWAFGRAVSDIVARLDQIIRLLEAGRTPS